MTRTINSIVRVTARLLVVLFTGIAFVSALVIALTQVSAVRTWALGRGLAELNKTLRGRVEVREITGNLITGFSLHDVRITAGGTTMFTAPLIDLRYQFRPIVKQKTINAEIILHNPKIRLERSAADSAWNFTKLLKPTPVSTDTTSSPFPFTINVRGLEIVDASVAMYDMTQAPMVRDSLHAVDFARLDLAQLNLSARARIAPDQQEAVLQHLSFLLPSADIRMVDLNGAVSVDASGARVRGLRLETGRTLLDLDAQLDSVRLLGSAARGPESWKRSPVRLELDAQRISTLELKRFLPVLSFLGGSPRIRLDAEGTYGDIGIKRLELGLDQSEIKLSGRLRNLNNPDSLYISTTIADSKVTYADVPIYLPGLGIPDLGYLGLVDLRKAQFEGYPLAFTTAIDATTKIGTARGAMRLDLRGRLPNYDANVAVVHGNMAPVLKDNSMASDFNGHVIASGTGFTMETVNSSFRLVSEASTVAGHDYRLLMAHGNIRDRGIINMDTMVAVWGPKGSPNERDLLERAPDNVTGFTHSGVTIALASRMFLSSYEASLVAGNPSVAFGGMLDIRNTAKPRYAANIRGHRFAISDIIPGATAARLTFTLHADGSGFNPDEMEGAAQLRMDEAELPDGRIVPPFMADLALVRPSATERNLTLRSDIADIDLTGQWNVRTVVNGVIEGINSVVEYVGRKSAYREEDPFAMLDTPFGDPVNATYQLTLKNLGPLAIFMNGARIAADGTFSGEMSGTSQLFSITATGNLKRFLYSQDSLRLRLNSAQFQVEMRNIAPGRIDDITTITATVRSDSIAQYNDIVFNAPRLSTSLENGAFRINGATGINGTLSIGTSGVVNMNAPGGYRVELDTLRVGLANGIRWRNEGIVSALVSDDAVTIDSFAIRRNSSELVRIHGALVGSSLRDVEVRASQGSVQAFADFFKGTDSYEQIRKIGGWVRDVRVHLNGPMADPKIDVIAAIDSVSYGGAPLGSTLLNMTYEKRNMQAELTIGGAALPTSGAAEAATEMERLRNDLNRRIDLANARLPERFALTKVTDLADRKKLSAQITELAGRVRALQDASLRDTSLAGALRGERASIVNLATQLQSLMFSEGTRDTLRNSKRTAQIRVASFPIDLALAARDERIIKGGPVDIQARTDSLPIGFLAPIFSGVQIRGGTADMQFHVAGNWPALIYSGEGNVHQARALVEGNNMFYSADGKIKFKDQVLSFQNMTIRNDPRDLPTGSAQVNGTVKFDGFKLGDLNITVRSNQLMVLSDATEAVSETLYGPLVIATGAQPLNFSGTLDRPKLSGDVDVIRGQLRMDRGNSAPVADNNPANYVDLAEWRRRTDSDNAYGPDLPDGFVRNDGGVDSTQRRDASEQTVIPGSLEENFMRVQERIGKVNVTRAGGEQSFADLLQLDLEVGIRGQLYVTIDLSPIEQLRIVLASDRRPISVVRGRDGRMDLRGAMKLRPGSKYNFIKAFDATGDLTFAGDMSRTRMAIVAEHSGRRLRAGNTGLEEYTVLVNIGGTLDKPDIKLSYSINGQPNPTADQDVRNRNAISLLLFGRTVDELFAGESQTASKVTDISGSVLGSGTSTIASRLLTDLLAGGTDFIRSIDIDLSGRAANARLNVVSQFGDVIVRAGGQITDPLNNGSLVVEMPLASLLDLQTLRNFSIQFEAARQAAEGVGVVTTSTQSQGFKFGFQFRNVW